VYPTNYAVNRRRNLAAIAETWPVGLGPGGHAAFVAREVASGRMTGTVAWADPHSTYIGVAAELGLAGLVGFTVLAISIALTLRRAWSTIPPGSPHRAALAAVIGALVAFAIDATVTDSMNFRHAWVALAGLAAWRPSPAAQRPHLAAGSELLAGVTGTV
jgi:O-antigen ligase